jgi:hypothetical protein
MASVSLRHQPLPAKSRYEVATVISVGVSARTSKLGDENVMNSRRFKLTSPYR